jgi:hypothetical protein
MRIGKGEEHLVSRFLMFLRDLENFTSRRHYQKITGENELKVYFGSKQGWSTDRPFWVFRLNVSWNIKQ